MWFNRKSTAFQQAIETLDKELKSCRAAIDKQVTQNKSDLLEFADLSSKMRRLYLRLVRISKIEPEASSGDPDENGEATEPVGRTPREIRDAISQKFGM